LPSERISWIGIIGNCDKDQLRGHVHVAYYDCACMVDPAIAYGLSPDSLHPYLFPFLLDMCQDTINSLYVVCFNTERAAR
jgi:hypothetical protein